MVIEDHVYVYPGLLKDLQEVLGEDGGCHIISFDIMEMKPVCGSQRFSQSREAWGYTTNTPESKDLRETLLLPLKCVYAKKKSIPSLHYETASAVHIPLQVCVWDNKQHNRF